ncbi:Guanine deaminase [Merluccius polli]|uniref:Guanine deaminase n=1 Tax=Merluccius polli TaxID=89951 RepID=A0AA47M509_MERPO|nr:Guanine deaminase [Merluccius polli]
MPGLVDTHIHASQYSYAGTALDLPLLQWLTTYTFPVESQYTDLEFARRVYTQVVKRTLRNGTTTACYFATIHTDASLLLAQIANDFGQRALVGKVCMDRNGALEHYKEGTQESLDETSRFIRELLKRKYLLVKPVMTPRFAVSCSGELLLKLSEIAKNNNLHIQSHISETKEEVKLVKQLFPDLETYTDVYNEHNLLTDKTIMAHGCHLSDKELELFHKKGTSLAHCPNSNISYVHGSIYPYQTFAQHTATALAYGSDLSSIYLSVCLCLNAYYVETTYNVEMQWLCSGLLDVHKVLSHKVKLGLGTDVAGGYSASMLDAVRRARDTSKALTIMDPTRVPLTFEETFRLATLGGSQALSMDGQTGNFEVGKDFDALRVNVAVPDGPIDLVQYDGPKILLEKFLNMGDDRNILEVYVAGRKVVPIE